MNPSHTPHTKHFFNWKLLLLLALYAIVFQFALNFSQWLQGNTSTFLFSTFAYNFLINYPNLLLICFLDYKLIRVLDYYLPWKKNFFLWKRVFLESISGILFAIILVVVINLLIFWFQELTSIPIKKLLYSASIGVVINMALLLTMEFYFQYTRSLETALDNEWLKKENSRIQYKLLKNQLNPHFLFNNLNTLSSLISIDNNLAKAYTKKLSNVYRHVLDQNNKELISVREELKILKDYIFLLETRFGNRMTVKIDVDSNYMQKLIIPLTLQTLIENAVKHNMLLDKRPLQIEIFTDKSYIIVQNNVQYKRSEVSWGIGLKNIKTRYLQFDKKINVVSTVEKFMVTLPLI